MGKISDSRRAPVALALLLALSACSAAEDTAGDGADAGAVDASSESDSSSGPDGSTEGLDASPGDIAAPATLVGTDHFAIVDRRQADLVAPFNGELVRLSVADGDRVSAGDEIAVVATDRDTDRSLVSLEAEIEQREESLLTAERDLVDARRDVDDLRLLDAGRRDFPDDFDSREEERRALVTAYLADLERGEDVQLAADRAGVIALLDAVLTEQRAWEDALAEERSAARAAARARAAVAALREQRDQARVLAPFDGIVRFGDEFYDPLFETRRPVEVGDFLRRSTTIGQVFGTDDPVVTVFVPETAIDRYPLGAPVDVEFAARPGVTVDGTVVDRGDGAVERSESRFLRGPQLFNFDGTSGAIRRDTFVPDSSFRAGPAATVFAVKVELADDAPDLRAGMSGLARSGDDRSLGEAVLEVAQAQVHRVAAGQAVTIVLAAFPDSPLQGEVVSTGRIPQLDAEQVSYAVRVDLAEGLDPALLRSGLTGEGRIVTGTG